MAAVLNIDFTQRTYRETDSLFRFMDRILDKAAEAGDTDAMGKIILKKGATIGLLGDYDIATQYIFDAQKMFRTIGNKRGLALTYIYLSNIVNIDLDRKLNFLRKALDIYSRDSSPRLLINIYGSYGLAYANHNQWDSALVYFERARQTAKKEDLKYQESVALGNVAYSHVKHGNYNTALRLSKEAIKMMPADGFLNTISIKHNLLEAFYKLNMPDSALYYFGLYKEEFSVRSNFRIDVYKLVSEIYNSIGNYKQALKYHHLADSVQEVTQNQNNKNLFRLLELEQESEIKKKEVAQLRAQTERDEAIRISLIIIFILSAVFTVILIHLQRQKNHKEKETILERSIKAETEQRLTEAELKNSELQRRVLSDELNFTNKELTSFAANIVKSSEHLDDLKDHVNDIMQKNDVKKMRESLRELNMKIAQVFGRDEERKEFLQRTQQVNHSLISYIKSNYPELTDNDLNLLVLMLLKFSSKEISTLYNIEVESVEKKRYRLRKKLGLKERENFDNFIDELIVDFRM